MTDEKLEKEYGEIKKHMMLYKLDTTSRSPSLAFLASITKILEKISKDEWSEIIDYVIKKRREDDVLENNS